MVEHGTAKCCWLDSVVKTTVRQGNVACCGEWRVHAMGPVVKDDGGRVYIYLRLDSYL